MGVRKYTRTGEGTEWHDPPAAGVASP